MKKIFTIIYLFLYVSLFSQTTPDLGQVLSVDNDGNQLGITNINSITGGTTTTSSITYKTTTGVGTTGADHIFQVGNNGGTEAMRILNSGNVGIGIAAPTAKLHISNTSSIKGINSSCVTSPSSNASANDFTFSITPSADFNNAYCTLSQLTYNGTQSITSGRGMITHFTQPLNQALSGTIANFTGNYIDCRNLGAGTITNFYGNRTITAVNSGGGTVTNFYANRVEAQTIGSSLTVGYESAIASGTGRYNLYMDGTAQNYFAGYIGQNVSVPLANLHIVQSAVATGTVKGLLYTGAINTNQTASTEISSTTFTTAGRQWATGAITLQREFLITAPTYSFVGASTISDAVTLGVTSPVAGTNATLTRSWAAQFTGNFAVSGSTYFGGLTTAPSALIHGVLTTEQLRLGYDASNYYSTTVSSTGGVTFNAVGSGSAFTFSDAVDLANNSVAVTQALNDSTTKIATTAFVDRAIANQNVFESTLSITSAQIKALNSTPLTIVAAPGSGKYIEVISASSTMTYNSIAYTTNTDLMLINAGANFAQLWDRAILAATTTKNTKFIQPVGSLTAGQTQIIENTALQVKVDTGNPAAGNSEIKVKVIYRIVTI